MKIPTQLVLLATLLMPTAQAQVTSFETRKTDVLLNPEGSNKLPFEVRMVTGTDSEKWREVTRPYYDYLADGIMRYTGRAGTCIGSGSTGMFLPGDTEAKFRSAEKAVVGAYLKDSSKLLGFKAYTLLKQYAPHQVTKNVTGSLYIFKSNPLSKVHNYYIQGYFYDRGLKQGVLMNCRFNMA